jgi:hypothetical protein
MPTLFLRAFLSGLAMRVPRDSRLIYWRLGTQANTNLYKFG